MQFDANSFKQLIQNSLLFSIDLVVLDDQKRILVGKRINRPAQGYWFVPGGRVYKNEPLPEAFKRITRDELGCCFNIEQGFLLGLFDHFYDDSVFGKEVSTHYINAPYLIKSNNADLITLPRQQHKAYRWLTLDEIVQDDTVHQYSKIFMDSLNKMIKTLENQHLGLND